MINAPTWNNPWELENTNSNKTINTRVIQAPSCLPQTHKMFPRRKSGRGPSVGRARNLEDRKRQRIGVLETPNLQKSLPKQPCNTVGG